MTRHKVSQSQCSYHLGGATEKTEAINMSKIEQLEKINYQRLVDNIISLTESEQSLHNYILKHFDELPYHGIVDLANNADVSKATIGRFLNKLGFTGYSAFKISLKAGLASNKLTAPIDVYQAAKPNDTKQSEINIDKHIASFSGNINHLIGQFSQNLNQSDLNQFIELITYHQHRLFTVGPSSSAAMALHFSTLVKYIRSQVTQLNVDTADLPKQLIDINQNDVLVIFSYYRFNNVVIDIARWFKQQGATVVVITNSHSNPYGKYCDLQFVLPSDAQAIFHSRMAGFMFIELVLHLAYEKLEDEGNFEKLEALFEFFGTFSAKVDR